MYNKIRSGANTFSTRPSKNVSFNETIDMAMQENKRPIMISNLKMSPDDWDTTLLSVANYQNSKTNTNVLLLEIGKLFTHETNVPCGRTDEGILYSKMYDQNIISKKANIDLESFHKSNLGYFGQKLVINGKYDLDYAFDKIFYFGEMGLVSMQMIKNEYL